MMKSIIYLVNYFKKGYKRICVNWINQPKNTGTLTKDRGYGSRVFNNQ